MVTMMISFFVSIHYIWKCLGAMLCNSQCVSLYNLQQANWFHYNDVIMTTIASQITSLTVVYSTIYSDADQRKHQSSAPLAFARGIHRGPVNSPHKGPVTRKMFPFDDVIMLASLRAVLQHDTLLPIALSTAMAAQITWKMPIVERGKFLLEWYFLMCFEDRVFLTRF